MNNKAPSSKLQAPEKHQASNSNRRLPTGAAVLEDTASRRLFGAWNLELPWSLEFGAWSFWFGAWPLLLALILSLPCLPARADSIIGSAHNFSVTGPGAIKAATESDACIFCHTAHHTTGAIPLWNHNASSVSNYIVYSSATLEAIGLAIPQPNGSSRLCLSCHDGTVALGSVNTRTTAIAMQNGVTTMPAGLNNLGTDLSGDHPISFVYDSALTAKDPQIKDPSTLTGKVRLDGSGRLQCTACHDPHNNQFGKFLVVDNTASALCLNCHNLVDWTGSAHATASQMATPVPTSGALTGKRQTKLKAATVAENGCANCHVPHFAGGKQQLMKAALPEQNCFPCHSGGKPGIKDVAADFKKFSVHPITQNAGAHNSRENVVNPATRHVTCADCHNPHATAATHANQAKAAGPLRGVVGLNAAGAVIPNPNREYELCFRCHADSAARGPSRVTRQIVETNTRLQFTTTASSFHPIEAPGRNPNVPSLLAPWTVSSMITCTDCHNSDQSPGAGGAGANGPHGSIYAPLLERQLILSDFTPESPASFDLCYKCHSRTSILGDQSFRATGTDSHGFPADRGHRFHIVDQKTACTTCHDSHGVQNQARLINFNRDYVSPSANGRLEYLVTGNLSGNCSLTCHGKDHAATSYPFPSAAMLRRARPK